MSKKVTDKYLRPGHIDQDRPVDSFVRKFKSGFKGEELPQRWRWVNKESFNKRYPPKDLPFHWANTASYQLLLIDGEHACRLWTDTPNTMIVDVSTALKDCIWEESLHRLLDLRHAPPSVWKKVKPLKMRVTLTTMRHVHIFMLLVLQAYDLIEDGLDTEEDDA